MFSVMKVASVAVTGRSRGSNIEKKLRRGPAPSRAAASSSSRGICRKKLVKKKIASGRFNAV